MPSGELVEPGQLILTNVSDSELAMSFRLAAASLRWLLEARSLAAVVEPAQLALAVWWVRQLWRQELPSEAMVR